MSEHHLLCILVDKEVGLISHIGKGCRHEHHCCISSHRNPARRLGTRQSLWRFEHGHHSRHPYPCVTLDCRNFPNRLQGRRLYTVTAVVLMMGLDTFQFIPGFLPMPFQVSANATTVAGSCAVTPCTGPRDSSTIALFAEESNLWEVLAAARVLKSGALVRETRDPGEGSRTHARTSTPTLTSTPTPSTRMRFD